MMNVERIAVRLLFVLLMVSAVMMPLQAQAKASVDNPVAQERQSKGWEYGPFFNFGNGVGDRSDYRFIWTGFQIGKPVTPVIKAGPLSGQFELGAEVVPFFQAYTPAPHTISGTIDGEPVTELVGGGTYTGASVAPVIFRWN